MLENLIDNFSSILIKMKKIENILSQYFFISVRI